ncbi:MAG: hypothetical protein C0510_05100 [Erythrobacter sp.]|nr:hypothetical protein [Erythrobacter sp.]
MFKVSRFGIAAITCLAAPAIAGEQVVYRPEVPEWALPADLDAAMATGESIVLLDEQVRIEDGVVHSFSDIAYRIDNPEALTQLGTLKLSWLPDKGDLIVHRLEIVRNGETIDLLGQGARYDVLRRERELEKRSIDGVLTATLSAPGLQVGDVLRISQTITVRDQALNGEVQANNGLHAEPMKLGFGRVRVSWPEDEDMHWRVHRVGDVGEPVSEGGYKAITMLVPIPEPDKVPQDAPARFNVNPLIQVSSFDDWKDVSRVLAPYFATSGTIAADGPIAAQISRITAETDDELVRVTLALRVVQDEVSYLLNGLNGGNYLPQSPIETWTKKYGDCKAKSLLLLAMLREMGIESEAVLVRSRAGDAVSALLPSLSAFDHMIVRARIDGQDYWLDGTTAGTRLDTVGEVPPFYYALPVRENGTDLVPVVQRWPDTPGREVKVTIDYSAGLDMPVTYAATVLARGALGSQMRPQTAETDEQDLRNYAQNYLENLVGDGVVYEAKVTYDDAAGVAKLTARGLMDSNWQWDRGRGSFAFDLPSTGFEFSPDRARQAWRDIPVQVTGPLAFAEEVELILPGDAAAYELVGIGTIDDVIAGVRMYRTVERTGNRLILRDDARKIPGEIAVADLSAERAKASRFKGGDPVLRAPLGTTRYWQHSEQSSAKRVAHLEEAYGAIIANDPKEAWRWSLRAKLREKHGDLDGALADYDKAIELEPTVERYLERSGVQRELGRTGKAIEDVRTAYDLDGQASHAIYLAVLLAESGNLDDAIALLDPLELSGDDRINLVIAKSEIFGEAGRADEGWAMLEEIAGERPGDGTVLNAQCWFMGLWSYRIEQAGPVCDEAVKSLEYSAAVLDSRALVYFRAGDDEKALRDLNAALASEPGQGESLYLRGVILSKKGDKAGERDIADALRLYRNFGRQYARYNISP